MKAIDRRQFGRIAVSGLAGLAALGPRGAESGPADQPDAASGVSSSELPPGLRRKKEGDIYRRPLGRTGLWVSELSLGGSPSPALAVFLAALERGVNYCDTSPRYARWKGEESVGRAIRGRRDKICVATKCTPNRDGVVNTADILQQVDGSLARLGTDYVEVLCVHRASTDKDLYSDWVLDAIDRLRRAGKARFFGASVHNTSPEFIRRYIESGHYQVLMIPFNVYFDPKLAKQGGMEAGATAIDEALNLAAQKGIGVIVMKSLAAGRAAEAPVPPGISPAQARIRWVLRRPEVSTILNEMTTFEYLKENLAASAADLSPAEESYLRRAVHQTSRSVCRMCLTCEQGCPAGLPIADLLRARMYAMDYGDRPRARALAEQINARERLESCRGCGQCEASCPWGVHTGYLFDQLRTIVA
ncbi:hypothetical protein AMJ85_07950 [candidate division BRC1 bacterium SM23_51]|nr:MAG: hypothetical protein AMJ85_07950 [candidate division BRC1 bacterium SM23_51]